MRRRFFWMPLPALALAPSGFHLVRWSDRDDSRCRPGCIVALGDSITSGAGLRSSESYPSQLRTAIDVPVWNAGVSGEKTGDALKRLPPLLARHEPRAVVLLLGINDSGVYSRPTALKSFARDLETAVTSVREAQATPVLCSLFPVDLTVLQANGLDADQWPRYDQQIRDTAGKTAAALVDLSAAAHDRQDVWLDGLHPNRSGAALIAGAVARTLSSTRIS